MNKHPLISIDFHSTVTISPSQKNKISRWLKMASQALGESVVQKKLMHPSWVQPDVTLTVSLMLCGERRIKKLNYDHRAKNKVTDVLSFPSFESMRVKKAAFESPLKDLFLGDIAICHQRAISQAKEFDIDYMDEFIHLFVHGFLHVIGFDHEISVKEEKTMQKWEKEILDRFSEIKKQGLLKPL